MQSSPPCTPRVFGALFVALFVNFSTEAIAKDALAAPKKVAEVEGVSEFQLHNGCRVLLYPDDTSRVVTVNMTVLVGSRHEGYGETGMAHLLEHMLFKGTPRHPDFDGELKERGAVDMNGMTWFDATSYYETLPASEDNTEWAIAVEADRLTNCFIRSEDLFSEMTVVRSEFEMSENSPGQILSQRIMANAYEWHNYGKTTIGNKADIERVPIPSLRAFYKKYYRPDNVVLIVTGKFDPTNALSYAQKYFGSLENPKSKLPKTYTAEPTQDGERVVYLRRVGGVPMVGTVHHTPASSHPDFAAVKVLEWILGDEPSGRLYEKLVKTGKADMVSATIWGSHDPGVLSCDASFSGTNEEAEAFAQEFAHLIESTAKEGVDPADVERAKADLAKEKDDAILDSKEFAMTLSDASSYGDWRLFFVNRDRIANVTADDVKRVAEKYLRKSNRTLGLYLPTKEPYRSEIEESPSIEDLVSGYVGKSAVTSEESFDPTPANIGQNMAQGKLSSGMPYTFIPKPTRGNRFFLEMTLNFGNREVFNKRARIKAAESLGAALTLGTKTNDVEAIDDLQAKLRAEIMIDSSGERQSTMDLGEVSISVSGQRDSFTETIELLKDMLRNPAFPQDEFELMKSEEASQMHQMRSNPMMVAPMTVSRLLNPVDQDHPDYVPTVAEAIREIEEGQLDDIQELYKFLSGKSGRVTICGAFDQEEAIEQLNSIVGDWKSDAAFAPVLSQNYSIATNAMTIETPDQASAMYFAGANIEARSDDKDCEALLIAADIIGGRSLDSRLADYVREKNGLSYQVGCEFDPSDRDRAGKFMTYATTNPNNKDALVAAVDHVYEAIVNEGFRPEELESSKTSYIEDLESMLADDESMVGIVHRYTTLGRDMKFLQARFDRISRLTLEEVNAAARKLLGANRITVLAGDFANAEAHADDTDQEPAEPKPSDDVDVAVRESLSTVAAAMKKKDYATAAKLMTDSGFKGYFASKFIDAIFMCMKDDSAEPEWLPILKKYKFDQISKEALYSFEREEEVHRTLLAPFKDHSAMIDALVQLEREEVSTMSKQDLMMFGIDPLQGRVERSILTDVGVVLEVKPNLPVGMMVEGSDFLKFRQDGDGWKYDGVDHERMQAAMEAEMDDLNFELLEQPDFGGNDISGEPIKLKDYRGKVVLLDFWGSWCVPCVASLPRLERLYKLLKPHGFEVVGIAADDKRALKRFFAKHPLPWKNIIDEAEQGGLSEQCGVAAFPTTVIYDRDGKVAGVNLHDTDLAATLAEQLDLDDDASAALQKLMKTTE